MKKEIADKWIKALRSGKYKQGTGSLNSNGNYCCLGVLCELAAQKGITKKVSIDPDVIYYDEEDSTLPIRVKEWAGISTCNGAFINKRKVGKSLIMLNDGGKSFKQIAAIIEKVYKKL